MPSEGKLFRNCVPFVFPCFMLSNQISVWSSFAPFSLGFCLRRASGPVTHQTEDYISAWTSSWYQRLEAVLDT